MFVTFESRLYSERCEVSVHSEIRRVKLRSISERCPLCSVGCGSCRAGFLLGWCWWVNFGRLIHEYGVL